MGDIRLPFPGQGRWRIQRLERLRGAGHRRLHEQVRGVDASEFLGASVNVDEPLLGSRRFDQCIAARRHLAQAWPEGNQEVGTPHTRGKLRRNADADVARIVGMTVVEQILEPERAPDRQLPGLGKALQGRTRRAVPAATAGDHQRPLGGEQHRSQFAQRAWRGPGVRRLGARQHLRGSERRQHVLRQREDDRPGPPLQRGVKGTRNVLGQSVGVLDLAHPLGEAERARAEHLAVVDLLEGLAIALRARHLANEQDHRRRILKRGVHPDARVRRPRAAGDEADAGSACELALRLGHEGGPALLSAGDEADSVAVLMKAVEHGEITFARHAEDGVDTLGDQGFDESMAGKA